MDEGFDWGSLFGESDWTSYLSTAGAIVSGIGLLTGKKDLTKFGALVSLGAGLAGLGKQDTAALGTKAPGGAAGPGNDFGAGQQPAEGSLMQAAKDRPLDTGAGVQEAQQQGLGTDNLGTPTVAPADATTANSAPSLVQQAQQRQANTTPAAIGDQLTGQRPSAVEQASKTFTGPELNRYLTQAGKTAQSIVGGIPGFVKDNKELIGIVGSAFGPEAERADLERQRFNQERSIMQRRLANLNSPVRLGIKTPTNPGG